MLKSTTGWSHFPTYIYGLGQRNSIMRVTVLILATLVTAIVKGETTTTSRREETTAAKKEVFTARTAETPTYPPAPPPPWQPSPNMQCCMCQCQAPLADGSATGSEEPAVVASINMMGLSQDQPHSAEGCYRAYDRIMYDNRFKLPGFVETNEALQITVTSSFQGLQLVEEKGSRVMLLATFGFEWADSRIAYNDTSCMLSYLPVFPLGQIWFPYLTIVNAYELTIDEMIWKANMVQVGRNGTLKFDFSRKFDVVCDMDLFHFPRDRHVCQVILSVGVGALNMTLAGELVPSTETLHSQVWNVEKTELLLTDTQLDRTAETILQITIQRKSTFYRFSLMVPIWLLSPLPIVAFVLPPENEDKVGITLTVMLAFFVMALTFFSTIPISDNIPILGWLFIYLLLTCTLATFGAALVTRRATSKPREDAYQLGGTKRPPTNANIEDSDSAPKRRTSGELVNRMFLILFVVTNGAAPFAVFVYIEYHHI